MKNQTAVEWLMEIYLTTGIDRNVHFHQALEIEKQQIIDAYAKGSNDRLKNTINDYYNETYGK